MKKKTKVKITPAKKATLSTAKTRRDLMKPSLKKSKTTQPSLKKVIKSAVKKIVKKPAKKIVSAAKKVLKTKIKVPAKTKNRSAVTKKTSKPKPTTIKKQKATPKQPKKQQVKPMTSTMQGTSTKQPLRSYVVKAGEEYMNPAQLKHFEKLLLQWKDELLHGAEITVQDMQATSTNFPDPVDRASQEEEFNLELRARDRERKLLKKIEETLHRIGDNNYGYCDDCGSEIGVRRLEARPTATQCIECKTIAEIREKQVGEIGKEKEEE